LAVIRLARLRLRVSCRVQGLQRRERKVYSIYLLDYLTVMTHMDISLIYIYISSDWHRLRLTGYAGNDPKYRKERYYILKDNDDLNAFTAPIFVNLNMMADSFLCRREAASGETHSCDLNLHLLR
jgi:hypothetical protein